jgi:hypothetical protein
MYSAYLEELYRYYGMDSAFFFQNNGPARRGDTTHVCVHYKFDSYLFDKILRYIKYIVEFTQRIICYSKIV